MPVIKRGILLGAGSLFAIASAIYLYGALGNVDEGDRANLSSMSAIIFIATILGSGLLLRFVRDENAE